MKHYIDFGIARLLGSHRLFHSFSQVACPVGAAFLSLNLFFFLLLIFEAGWSSATKWKNWDEEKETRQMNFTRTVFQSPKVAAIVEKRRCSLTSVGVGCQRNTFCAPGPHLLQHKGQFSRSRLWLGRITRSWVTFDYTKARGILMKTRENMIG